jgi:hypothetical protein
MRQVVVQLAKEVAWAPVAIFIIHAILGHIFGHEPYVDPVMHFMGGVAITYFLRRAVEIAPQYLGTPSGLGVDLLAFGLACFAALVWEFGELFSDIFLGTNIQRGAPNTLRDLALGLGGACVYLIVRRFCRRGIAT